MKISAILAFVLRPSGTAAFQLHRPPPTCSSLSLAAAARSDHQPNNETPSTVTRSGFLTQAAAAFMMTVGAASPAHADITSKLASSAALRNVKSVQKKLSTMELYVVQQDYLAIKEALRVAPFSDIRKSGTTLVRGGEDSTLAEPLQAQYKTFMSSLEKMDGLASLGMRGRKVGSDEFYAAYKATVDSLESFLAVAQEAADIPVQYAD